MLLVSHSSVRIPAARYAPHRQPTHAGDHAPRTTPLNASRAPPTLLFSACTLVMECHGRCRLFTLLLVSKPLFIYYYFSFFPHCRVYWDCQCYCWFIYSLLPPLPMQLSICLHQKGLRKSQYSSVSLKPPSKR